MIKAKSPVNVLSITPLDDENILISGVSSDIMVFSLMKSKIISSYENAHLGIIDDLKLSGNVIATVSKKDPRYNISLWQLENFEITSKNNYLIDIEPRKITSHSNTLCIYSGKVIYNYSLKTGELISIIKNRKKSFTCISFLNKDELLLACIDGKLETRNLQGELLKENQVLDTEILDIQSNNNNIFVTSWIQELLILDKEFNLKYKVKGFDSGISKIAVNPINKNMIACGTLKGYIVIFDLKTGKLSQPVAKNESWICDLKFSPSGNRLISSDYSGNLLSISMS